MTKFRPIEGKDREAVRSVIEGTGAFKPHEVDVAMGLVDESLAQPGRTTTVLSSWRKRTARSSPTPASERTR